MSRFVQILFIREKGVNSPCNKNPLWFSLIPRNEDSRVASFKQLKSTGIFGRLGRLPQASFVWVIVFCNTVLLLANIGKADMTSTNVSKTIKALLCTWWCTCTRKYMNKLKKTLANLFSFRFLAQIYHLAAPLRDYFPKGSQLGGFKLSLNIILRRYLI